MTECKGDCSTWADPSEGEWFKIFQAGLLSGTVGHGKWGTNEMMDKGFSVTTKIPASLKPGNYLIRHETIVSRAVFEKPIVLLTKCPQNLARAPAEFYPECAQLKVTGSGTTSPGKEFLFKLPGAYKTTGKILPLSKTRSLRSIFAN
jgi:cellulase